MESEKKFWCMALSSMLLCAGMITVFSFVGPVGAGDVGSTTLTSLEFVPSMSYQAVEFSPEAGYGMAVGLSNIVYRFQEPFDSMNWTDTDSGNAADNWHDVIWNGTHYLICGYDGTGANNIRAYNDSGLEPFGNTGAADILRGAAMGSPDNYLFVGNNPTSGVVFYYREDLGFRSVTGADIPAEGDILTGVAYDPTSEVFVIVGYNGAQAVIYYVSETTLKGNTFEALQLGDAAKVTGVLNAVEVVGTHALAVGTNGGVYKIGAGGVAEPIHSKILADLSSAIFKDLTLVVNDTVIEGAIIVGSFGTHGVVLRYQVGKDLITNVSAPAGKHTDKPLSAVAYKGYGSPRYGILLGTDAGMSSYGYRYNSIEASAEINVNVNYPQIESVDLYRNTAPEVSLLNGFLDVDPGTGSVAYILNVSAYHNDTWDLVGRLEVQMWHSGTHMDYPGGPNNNNRASFSYNTTTHLTDPDVFYAPQGAGENEVDLLSAQDVTVNSTHHDVLFEFVFNKQVWAGTWDLNVTVWDIYGIGFKTFIGSFNIYRYTELSSSGLPADQSGGGPPGAAVDLGPGDQNIYFSANYNYSVKVWITDLWDASLTNSMPALNMSLVGGEIASYTNFTAEGYSSAQNITNEWTAPNEVGNITDLNNVGGVSLPLLNWRYYIPAGALEGQYYGTMTFIVEQTP